MLMEIKWIQGIVFFKVVLPSLVGGTQRRWVFFNYLPFSGNIGELWMRRDQRPPQCSMNQWASRNAREIILRNYANYCYSSCQIPHKNDASHGGSDP